ncbi:PTS sugar transporter subunit IIB [Actinomycetaceae bacterium TAE3-ERU4]|nr:PTS sugar transporter subunit IIB [Actinomycetaceae bacterium TAE3-ERU4]
MLNITTVCGMGFGTSLMLAMQVREILANEGIEADTNPVDLGSFKTMSSDMVVAPADMESQVSGGPAKKIVLIDNLVDKNEVKTKVLEAVKSLLD